jgi:hypothetical protein
LAGACKSGDGAASPQPVASTPCTPLADPAVTIEYEAITTDGHYVVTLTDTATRATTRRVFYGAPGRMVEGTITDIENSCAHYVYFDAEGRSYSARLSTGDCTLVMPGMFSVDLADGGFVPQGLTVLEAGTLQLDGGVAPDAFSYVCF